MKKMPSCPPVGYVLAKVEGEYVAIPGDQAGNVAALFEAAKGDASLRLLLKEAHASGLRSRTGKALGVSSLWNILTNPFYAGMVRGGGDALPGNHRALVSPEVFEAVQKRLRRRRANARN